MLQVLPRIAVAALGIGLVLAGLATAASARERAVRRAASAAAADTADAAGIDCTPRTLRRLDAGLEIGDEPPEGWTHLVLFAVPRVASGDVDDLPRVFGRMATMFRLTIVADVGRLRRSGEYALRDVAIGFAREVEGRQVIVSSETLGEGSGLDAIISRRVLEGNEKCLDDVKQVARTPTMTVFDAQANMLRDGKHEQMVCRHAIAVDPQSGELTTCVWLLAKERDDYALAERSLRKLEPGLHEDRELNVETDLFVLGLPTPDALALVELPEGQDVRYTDELAEVAATREFTPDIAVALEDALRGAVEERPARGE
jgi:hypothetical protein